MLLLDEATSALDVATERAMSGALDAAARGRTTVSIAHRLSTVRHADQIIVMQAGGIVERGTYEELVARDGAFAQLARQDARRDQAGTGPEAQEQLPPHDPGAGAEPLSPGLRP